MNSLPIHKKLNRSIFLLDIVSGSRLFSLVVCMVRFSSYVLWIRNSLCNNWVGRKPLKLVKEGKFYRES